MPAEGEPEEGDHRTGESGGRHETELRNGKNSTLRSIALQFIPSSMPARMNDEPTSRDDRPNVMLRSDKAPRPPVTIRPMISDDIPFAAELRAIAGWNQTERDWAGYIEFEPSGCYVAEAEGRRVGTATSIRYGDRFGWIGMVLVHPDARRLGIGTKLLRHVIEYLQRSGTRCVKLDATAMGRKVYVPMGFLDEFELSRFEGVAPDGDPIPDGRVAPLLTDRDANDIAEFDAPAFGAERASVLSSLSQRKPEWCFVAREGRNLRGYLIAREGQNAAQLGPWVASDAATADFLLRAFFGRVAGRRVFVDVPHPNSGGCDLIRSYGFTVQRGFARMHLGSNLHPGIPERIFGCSGAEKG